MAKICIYDSTDQDRQVFSALSTDHEVVFIDEPVSEENIVSDADVVSVFVCSKMTKNIISKFKNLQHIAARSTGVSNIDIKTARSKNISISNVPTYGEHTVAEYTFALMLMTTRKMRAAINQVQTEQIESDLIHGIDLHGKTLGIVGGGRIGRRVARIAKAFGMKVSIFDPFVDESVIEKMDCSKCSLNDLLAESDIVSLHAPLTENTKHIIGKQQFKKIKPGAILINTARGELVDTKHLVSALRDGIVSAVGLDVLEDEKLLDQDEEELLLTKGRPTNVSLEHALEINILKNMPNVIITSHNAYNTVGAINRICQTTLENIQNFFDHKPYNGVEK